MVSTYQEIIAVLLVLETVETGTVASLLAGSVLVAGRAIFWDRWI